MKDKFTLERFIELKGSKSISTLQCRIFGVKDLRKGWYNRYKHNEVPEGSWKKAVESLDSMRNTEENVRRGGVKTLQHLYLLRSGSGLYKIGISQNVKARAVNIRSASGFDVEILSVWNTGKRVARTVEKAAHSYFKEFLHRGEWFKIDDENFVDVFDKYVKQSTSGGRKINWVKM